MVSLARNVTECCSHPSLDSGRRDERAGYVHKTSGKAKRKLSTDDAYQEPNPRAPTRESATIERSAENTLDSHMQCELPILPAVHEDDIQSYYNHDSSPIGGHSSGTHGPPETDTTRQVDPGKDPDAPDFIGSESPESGRRSKRIRVALEKHTFRNTL